MTASLTSLTFKEPLL
jgi:hypothetical protein